MHQDAERGSGVRPPGGADDQGVVPAVLRQDHGQPRPAEEPRGPQRLQNHGKDFGGCLRKECPGTGQPSWLLNI